MGISWVRKFKRDPINLIISWITYCTDLSSSLGKIVVSIVLIVFAFGLAFVTSTLGVKFGGILFIGILGIPVVVLSLIRPAVGLYCAVALSYFLFLIKRVLYSYDLPLGVVVNLFFYISFFGVFLRSVIYKNTDWSKLWNPIIIAVLVNVVYNFTMAFNPNAISVTDWVQLTLRGQISMICIIIVCYYVFSNLENIARFTKFWLALSFIAACYSLYQEYVGLPAWDMAWVNSSPELHGLNFIQGRYRKWGILSDVSEFGLLMAFTGIFLIVLFLGKFSLSKKIAFIVAALIVVMGVAFSGTRTAFVTVPIGLVLYGLMTINNKVTLFFIMVAILVFLVLLFGPIYNPTVSRFRSAFRPNEDPSMQVRENNRERIRPYIYSHPIGGGIGTVGLYGRRYEGIHPLAGFPPDSGYMATVLEKGYIGLIIQLSVFFYIVSYGIYYFYKSRTPLVKILYAAYTSSLFAMSVAHFSQVAIGKTPSGYVIVATYVILSRLKDFDSRNE